MPELPSKSGRNWELMPEVNSQFLPLLEGNSGIGKELTSGIDSQFRKWIPHFRSIKWSIPALGIQFRKWTPHFRSIKWSIPELKWGIEKNLLLCVYAFNTKVNAPMCAGKRGKVWLLETTTHTRHWSIILSDHLSLHQKCGRSPFSVYAARSHSMEIVFMHSEGRERQIYELCWKTCL